MLKVAPMKVYPDLPTELGDEWTQQVYGDEKPCLKTLPQLPEIASQVCVRSTNSNLSKNSKKRLLGKQTAPDFGHPADFIQALKDLVQNPSADASASSSKALKLTIFNQQPSPSKALASGPSAVDLLQRKHMGQGTSPAKPALALTNGTEAVSPKSSPKTTMKDGGDGGKKNSDVPAKEEKSLEDYENEAMEMLMKRPAIALFDTVLKKPAAKNSSPSSSSKVPKLERTIFGCLRCRGNPLGCETCRSETFGGKRFEGRSAYNAFVKAQAAKGKVYK